MALEKVSNIHRKCESKMLAVSSQGIVFSKLGILNLSGNNRKGHRSDSEQPLVKHVS